MASGQSIPAVILPIAIYGNWFLETDIQTITPNISPKKMPAVAERLNAGAAQLILLSGQPVSSPKIINWCTLLKQRIASLAELFEPETDDGVDRAARVLRRFPKAVLDDGQLLDTSEHLESLLGALSGLAGRAGLIADAERVEAAATDDRGNIVNRGEIKFFEALRAAYELAYDKLPGISTDARTRKRTGPAIRFAEAAIGHLQGLELPAAAHGLVIKMTPERIAERMKGAGIRRRSGKGALPLKKS